MVDSPLSSPPIHVLLVQCRSDSRMEEQERSCFLERARLPSAQLHSLNLARGDEPSPSMLDKVDALLIGGAGKYSATQTYPWTEPLHALVRDAVERELPTMGSCWGHQVIVRALGGRVAHDPERAELGCGWVELTDAGADDLLFRQFSRRFRANMGHHDRVLELPPSTIELARNDQPYQAFRMKGMPVYGTQFHSELDATRERERILVYREYYRTALPDEETVQRVLNDLAATTEVDNLLYNFLATFVAHSASPGPSFVRPADDGPFSAAREHGAAQSAHRGRSA